MKEKLSNPLAGKDSEFLQLLREAVFFVDSQGHIVYANPSACLLVGYDEEHLCRAHVSLFLRPQDVGRALGEASEQSKRPTRRGEYHLARANGTSIWVEMSAVAFPSSPQGLMVWIMRDVTACKALEADIAKRTKLEAVSTMASGIAHDWNNILSIILGNLDLALSKCRPEDPITPMLRSANAAALEARELIFKFLCFARSAVQERTTIHAGSLAEEVCRTTLAGKPVTGQVMYDNGLWSLKGDPQLLRTLLANVLDNARAASPVGGRILVRLKNTHVNSDDPLCSQLNPGPYLRIDIQDEGPGIPSEILDRVFDPYFSTKPRGTQKGMGMGLAVAWGIVQSHGGHIAITSRDQVGSRVTIYLPAVPDSRPLAAGLTEMEGPLRAKILVMDDEPMLRQLAEDVMEYLGYQCETARHGKEAVAKYKQAMDAGEPYDLVILDLTVKGGLGAIPTMAQLLAVDPKVKAVVYTGYSGDPILENYKLYGFQGALPKPYAVKDMADLIRRVLGKREH
ncbi:hybrid sensor histidine kinase/response regulator [Desulfosoma caldarium]|uniref:histidine kinase n=1 Tax=Desulfosoma caldarium TaxID=610254 RepID=A0A3N1UWM5_9BACT|nr:ATP-binding protein [Desulfosoma caldarium]ROQ92321.1 PAS domain S-box-containing protein [Desulfosoma caldarium]